MLTTNLALAEKYDYLSEKFQKAFAFLRETDLESLPVGNIPIDGDEIYANVQSYTTMNAGECPFESHRVYFDIQYMADGEEIFGYEPASDLTPSTEYDSEKDLLFYEEPEESGAIFLKKGDSYEKKEDVFFEYAHESAAVVSALRNAGFGKISVKGKKGAPAEDEERLFFTAVK